MSWWLIIVFLFSGCSRSPLTSGEEELLGTWGTLFSEEDGTKVQIVWTFESLYVGDRTAWNEIYENDVFMSQRRGKWEVLDSLRLRVVLDRENLYVTDHYEDNAGPYSFVEDGPLVGGILADLLRALTDDEYTINYARDGDVLRMKWYNDEYHPYIRMDK